MNKISKSARALRGAYTAAITAVRSSGPRIGMKIKDVIKTPEGRASVMKAIPALRGRSLSGKQIVDYVKKNPLNSFFALSMAADLVYLVDDLVDSDPEFAAAVAQLDGVDNIDTLALTPQNRDKLVEANKAKMADKAAKVENLTVAQLREARDEVESLEMAVAAMPGDSYESRVASLRAIMRVIASGDEVFLLREALESLK